MPAPRFTLSFREKTIKNPTVKLDRLEVESVAVAFSLPGHPGIDGKEQRQIGNQASGRQGIHFAQGIDIEAASIALVDDRRIGVPVAKHQFASGQRGPHHFGHVLRAVCKKQKEFGQRLDCASAQKNLPHRRTD